LLFFHVEAQECDCGFIGRCTFIFKGNLLWLFIGLLAIDLGENGEGMFPLLRALPRRYSLSTLVDLFSEWCEVIPGGDLIALS